MKVGQRDIMIGFRQWWIVNTILGREWVEPMGEYPGFWLRDIPRRFEVHTPFGHLTLALTPGSRWGGLRYDNGELVKAPLKWIQFERN